MLIYNDFVENYSDFLIKKSLRGSRFMKTSLEYIKENRKSPRFKDLRGMLISIRAGLETTSNFDGIRIYDGEDRLICFLSLPDCYFKSDDYLCHDGDENCVRYERDGRIYKRKIGKILNEMVENHNQKMNSERYGSRYDLFKITPKMQTWYCEIISDEYAVYASKMKNEKVFLKIDEDFQFIYDSDNYRGDINSCQKNAGNHSFFNLISGAKACSLIDEDDQILCRAILWEEVEDYSTGEVVRLLDRQYSINNDRRYKAKMIEKLKERNLIDGYKDFDAGAYDCTNFVKIKDFTQCCLRIHLKRKLYYDDSVSWMDTFCSYIDGETELRNDDDRGIILRNSGDDVVYSDFDQKEYHYDEYLGYDVEGSEDEFVEVEYNGRTISVHEDTRENHFRWVDYQGLYFHEDEVIYSAYDSEYYLECDVVYSEYHDCYLYIEDAEEVEEEWYHRDDIEYDSESDVYYIEFYDRCVIVER